MSFLRVTSITHFEGDLREFSSESEARDYVEEIINCGLAPVIQKWENGEWCDKDFDWLKNEVDWW